MAPPVKCLYCGQQFDRDEVEYVSPQYRRYAHKECAEYADKIHAAAQEKLGKYYIKGKVNKDIQKFCLEDGFDMRNLWGAVHYWFYIKNIDKEIDASRSGGGIGIIPWIKQEYFEHEAAQRRNKQLNVGKHIKDFVNQDTREVDFDLPPIRKPRGMNFFNLK